VTLEEIRSAFPVLRRFAYLNAGTFGPVPSPVADAVAERRRLDLELGRSGRPYSDWILDARERVRERLATAIGVDAANIALTRATTDGCNIVLAGLDLRPEDEVVTTDAEHFGLVGALGVSAARIRVASVADRTGEEALETILAEVGPRTRLIALSHVLWTTGNMMPVLELKERTGLPVLVDGAQSVGAIPVDARPFDFYTVSCQKWLCGLDGTGALYVRDPEALRIAWPSYFSQETHERDGTFQPWPTAARFDPAWIPPASLRGLLVALGLAPEWRYDRIADLAAACRDRLAERFEVVTAPGQAGLVSFRPGEDPEEVSARLYEAGVVVRFLPDTDLVRVSCGWWNSEDDLDRLLDAL
jgi:L-cysteine/cystine lyase